MRKLAATVFSLIFLATAFATAHAQKSNDYLWGYNPALSGPASTDTKMSIYPPPTTTIIPLNDIRDLVALETFEKWLDGWRWKYDGYHFEGTLPPIKMYWAEISLDTTCYIPVFYTSLGYPYIVIRLSRINSICGEDKDELLKEYIAGKYVKAKIVYFIITGDPYKNGYIEISIILE